MYSEEELNYLITTQLRHKTIDTLSHNFSIKTLIHHPPDA